MRVVREQRLRHPITGPRQLAHGIGRSLQEHLAMQKQIERCLSALRVIKTEAFKAGSFHGIIFRSPFFIASPSQRPVPPIKRPPSDFISEPSARGSWEECPCSLKNEVFNSGLFRGLTAVPPCTRGIDARLHEHVFVRRCVRLSGAVMNTLSPTGKCSNAVAVHVLREFFTLHGCQLDPNRRGPASLQVTKPNGNLAACLVLA